LTEARLLLLNLGKIGSADDMLSMCSETMNEKGLALLASPLEKPAKLRGPPRAV